jgi:hypothetical protein
MAPNYRNIAGNAPTPGEILTVFKLDVQDLTAPIRFWQLRQIRSEAAGRWSTGEGRVYLDEFCADCAIWAFVSS